MAHRHSSSMGYATMLRMHWRRSSLPSRPQCLPKLLLSRLECQRRIWFVQNAGLAVFHHHNASLWGRDFSSLYADIKALGRIIMKNFRHRDTIIYVHAKMIDGAFLYLLYNLIVHRTSSFLKVLCGCILSFAVSSHLVEDIVCDASGLSKRCAR